MQGVSLYVAAGGPGGERELAGVLSIFFQAQPAHLKERSGWKEIRQRGGSCTTAYRISSHILTKLQVTQLSCSCANLDAVFEEVARSGEALLLIQRFAENDDLLKQKHPPLLHSGQKPAILVRHHEGVLEDQSALCHNFTLKKNRDRAS